MSMFVRFMDMHSGGGTKLEWEHIYIEADTEEQARMIFYNRFGRNPEKVTCTCCGEDYSISEPDSLAQATRYDRNLHSGDPVTLEVYEAREDVLILRTGDLTEGDRAPVDVPEEGYVWQ